ncbi:MAG: tetratricopeptide repeat protein [Pirellulales bacterium]
MAGAGAALALAWAVGILAQPARAELTVADLTSKSVAAVGPYQQDVADALKAFAAGDYGTAFARLESAKKSTPPLSLPEVMMARLYFDGNVPAAGVGMLEQALRRDPKDPEALILLAERALAEGRLTEAGMVFAKAAPLVEEFSFNPKRRQDLQIRMHNGAAIVDERAGNLAGAQKHLEELCRLDTQNAQAMERLGRVIFQQGSGDKIAGQKAYEQFKAAAAADPKMPPPEIAMAAQFKDKIKAEQWLNHALSAHPDDVRTHIAIGQYRLRENRIDEAKTHSDKALALDPNGLDANLLAGLVARLQYDYPTATKLLGAAHLLSPGDPSIINNLALVLIELPDDASHLRAGQFAELNAVQHPNSAEALMTFGWICYHLNRRADAQRALKTAFQATAAANDNRMNADMGYYLAVLARDAGRIPDALQLLKESLNTTQPFAYRKPAQALLAQLEKMPAATAGDARSKAGAVPRSAARPPGQPAAPPGDNQPITTTP